MSKHPARLLAAVLVSAWAVILLTPCDTPAQLYRYTDKDGVERFFSKVVVATPQHELRSLDRPDTAPASEEE